ncbi:MAG: RNA methyltransferase [Acidobacteria bacterium]|nr:RNA methyltransferase [Acidobacteriota bacterium]
MIVPVADAHDPRLGDYAHVGDHAWLRSHGLFVAEGRLIVGRLIDSPRFPIRSVLLTPSALQGFGGAIDIGPPVYVADQQVLNEITGFDFHRGCLALAQRPPEESDREHFSAARLLLAIEGVGNPDNIGGLFRVAGAFGAGGVLLDPKSGDPFYRKAVRTSMGAVLTVPFERVTPWPSVLDDFKSSGFCVVALVPSRGARPLDDFALDDHGPLIVLVGAEGPGLSDEVTGTVDVRVKIPMAPGVDSLNVTVAAGIALSRLVR